MNIDGMFFSLSMIFFIICFIQKEVIGAMILVWAMLLIYASGNPIILFNIKF